MDSYLAGKLNNIGAEKANYDAAAIFAVLDEATVAHVGFVAEGRPIVRPMIHGRVGDTLYLHGAKAARIAKGMVPGLPICLTVTLTDGMVAARAASQTSMNYRSVVIHGTASLVTDAEEAERALAAISNHAQPSRWAETRETTGKEFEAASVLRVVIGAASLKSLIRGAAENEAGSALAVWRGSVPSRLPTLTPTASGQVQAGASSPGLQALIAQRDF